MRIDSELCHVDSNKIIVRITGYKNNECIGSSLGEGRSIREAEKSAIDELIKRNQEHLIPNEQIQSGQHTFIEKSAHLKGDKISNESKKSINEQTTHKQTEEKLKYEKIKPKSDWTEELAEIDYEIARLGWSREQENEFLEKILEFPKKNRISDINQIKDFINVLKSIKPEQSMNKLKEYFTKETLIRLSDKRITELNWSTEKARDYLNKSFNVSSRNNLTIIDLIKFNELLNKDIF